jgi:hypothetical protein
MLTYRNLALAKRVGQPTRNHGHDPLMVADVRFVHAWHGRVAYLMRHNTKKVAGNSIWVEVNYPFTKVRHAFAQLLGRWPLNLDRPPLSIELETQRWPLAAPAWGAGDLFHAKEGGSAEQAESARPAGS